LEGAVDGAGYEAGDGCGWVLVGVSPHKVFPSRFVSLGFISQVSKANLDDASSCTLGLEDVFKVGGGEGT
jgi:hypothetical protein